MMIAAAFAAELTYTTSPWKINRVGVLISEARDCCAFDVCNDSNCVGSKGKFNGHNNAMQGWTW